MAGVAEQREKADMAKKIVVIPGDGIGEEITASAVACPETVPCSHEPVTPVVYGGMFA